MIILGIETSCDETAAAVLLKDQKGITILSNVVASSASLQAKYGGVIPEQAAREQIKSVIPVIEEALHQTFPDVVIPANAGIQLNNNLWIPDQVRDDRGKIPPIDAIAVTYGPGLIGSLLVGVETAKTLATVWSKPLIPVNHLLGHFYANWINNQYKVSSIKYSGKKQKQNPSILYTPYTIPNFPCLGLLVSGGHTDLVLFENHHKYKYLGGTRDDAAGECFDKCARLLGLPYPGGPEISNLAQKGDPTKFKLPIPMKESKDLDFSYSGLKTAVANLVHSSPFIVSLNNDERTNQLTRDLAAAIENAIVQSLVDKVLQALKLYPVKNVMIAGGVAANQKLAHELKLKIENLKLKINLHIPSANLCTDNGAMICARAFFEKPLKDPLKLQANPNLSLA